MKAFFIIMLLTAGTLSFSYAQSDPWVGTWRIQTKEYNHVITTELQIGQPEQGLYPALLTIRDNVFSGTYEVLLAKKNAHQLGIGRGKYPISETPFKIGQWMIYLNGTLDLDRTGTVMTIHRMWIDQFGLWMRGLYDGDEIFVHSKTFLRDLLYRELDTLKKVNRTAWQHPHTQRILHPEGNNIYYGIYDRIDTRSATATIRLYDEEILDKDTVTLLHNGRLLLDKAEIDTNNRQQEIRLDTGMNIFIFFADNYGKRPPNTGNLHMALGANRYGFDFTHRSNAYATFMVAQIYRQPGKDSIPPPDRSNDRPGDTIALSQRAASRKSEAVITIPVDRSDVTLELWDGQTEDGDSISIRLNDRWILTGFPVKKKMQQVSIQLQAGENRLLFLADNLGSIPPNTAELRIRYGKKSRMIGLNTDMKRNNEILLIYQPDE